MRYLKISLTPHLPDNSLKALGDTHRSTFQAQSKLASVSQPLQFHHILKLGGRGSGTKVLRLSETSLLQ